MTSQSVGVSGLQRPKAMTAAERLERYGDRTGPGSAGQVVIGDGAMFYAVIPILAYVVMSEGGAKGVDDHDRVANLADRDTVRFEGAWDRLIDTVDLVAGIAFAEGDQRALIAETMREIHRHVEGHLDDGTRYHAWNKDLWAWTWAGIIKPPLDAYQEFHGPVSQEFAEDYYIGALQLGDLIGVRGLPDTYEDFTDYWENVWMPQTRGTGTAKFILSLAQHPPLPAATPWLPKPIWDAVTWPARNALTAGAHIVMDDRTLQLLGTEPTGLQRASAVAHRTFGRVAPRAVTRNLFGTAVRWRLRHGNNSWERHYSPEALAGYRDQVAAARAQGCPEPVRPSKRG